MYFPMPCTLELDAHVIRISETNCCPVFKMCCLGNLTLVEDGSLKLSSLDKLSKVGPVNEYNV